MKQHINTLIIFVTVVVAAIIIGKSWKSAHTEKGTISVNGIAKEDITSDQVKWMGYLSAQAKDTKSAYEELKKDTGIFMNYLISKGISRSEVTFMPVRIQADYGDYYYDKNGIYTRKLKGYVLTEEVKVESKEVEKVENASKEVGELIDSGETYFVEESMEYYYTKLDTLKMKMIANATQEAYKRALIICENSHTTLGDMKHSEMSTFDVTAKNSAEQYTEASTDYYYGNETYNTSSRYKTAVVTIKIDYEVK